jgi:hypothetical protein
VRAAAKFKALLKRSKARKLHAAGDTNADTFRGGSGIGAQYVALYDYTRAAVSELSFAEGDVFVEVTPLYDGWASAKATSTGLVGEIPTNYIEELGSDAVPPGTLAGAAEPVAVATAALKSAVVDVQSPEARSRIAGVDQSGADGTEASGVDQSDCFFEGAAARLKRASTARRMSSAKAHRSEHDDDEDDEDDEEYDGDDGVIAEHPSSLEALAARPNGGGGGGGGGGSGAVAGGAKVKYERYKLCCSAVGLDAKDANGLSDPYMIVALEGSMERLAKTEVIKKSLNVTWKELEFEAAVDPLATVSFSVWDWDRIGGDDFIGKASVPFADLLSARPGAKWSLTNPKKQKGGVKEKVGYTGSGELVLIHFETY